MAEQLRGRVALVTGAGRGIGRGIATVLASRGATLVVADVDEAAARETAGEIVAAGGAARALHADVTSQDSMNGMVAEALRQPGRIDICVANAGVIGAPGFEARDDFIEADWDLTYRVNVKGLFHTFQAVAPHMKERRSGRIINIASHGGRPPRGSGGGMGVAAATTPYSVSKAAAIQWTFQLALQLAAFNITVNAVCPGTLWTPMWEKIALRQKATDPALADTAPYDIFVQQNKARNPLGRGQTPEDIGRAVAFFASDDARVITGQALNVNGGAVMS